MTTRYANGYLLSGILHAGVAALALFLAFGINAPAPQAPKVFELVAGAGDNYGATAAPALGAPGGIKLRVPAPVQPLASPAVPEEPAPVRPATPPERPLKASLQKDAQPRKAEAVPNFTKVMERTASRRAARLEARYKKQLAEEERREAREEALQRAAEARASKVQKIDAEGIREGVVGGSVENKTGGAGGKALTREEGELLDGYFALLKARIKENYVDNGDASDRLTARLEFYVAADGALSGVRIIRSSGNGEFDRSVLEAFHRTSSIGPRPDGKGETVTMEFDLREDEAN
jgi:colicin import membrane protein